MYLQCQNSEPFFFHQVNVSSQKTSLPPAPDDFGYLPDNLDIAQKAKIPVLVLANVTTDIKLMSMYRSCSYLPYITEF